MAEERCGHGRRSARESDSSPKVCVAHLLCGATMTTWTDSGDIHVGTMKDRNRPRTAVAGRVEPALTVPATAMASIPLGGPLFPASRCTLMFLLILACTGAGTESSELQSVSPSAWILLSSVNGAAQDLGEAHEAAMLSDGSLVVADAGEQELVWFAQEGRLARRFGRRGSGPGEFRDLNSVLVTRGDTVLAYDGRLSRLTVLSASGDLIRMQRLPGGVGPTAKLVGRLLGGDLVFMRETMPMPRARNEGLVTDSTYLVIIDPSVQGRERSLGSIPIRNVLADGVGVALLVMRPPYPVTASVGVCGDSILIAFGDTNSFEWLGSQSAGGRRVVSMMLTRMPTTQADADSLLAAQRRRGTTDLSARARRALVRHSGTLRRPYYSRGALDVDGSVWILVDEGGSNVWRNVDAEGNWTEVPPIPMDGRILQMTRTRVLLHTRDENGFDLFRILSRSDPLPGDHCSGTLSGTVTTSLIG